jgi:hypothetical protein
MSCPATAAHGTEHVATEDEGAEVLHRPPGEFIVQIDRSPTLPVHRAEGLGVKKPLKELGSALT